MLSVGEILADNLPGILAGEILLPVDEFNPEDRALVRLINQILKGWRKDRDLLEFNRATLESLLHSIPQGVFWKDTDSVFLGCNQTFASMVGLKNPVDLIGKTDYDLRSSEKAIQFRAIDVKVLESLLPHTTETNVSDHIARYARTTKAPLSTPSGEVFGVMGVTEDVTDRKIAENDLKLSERKFRLLAESVSDIIWMMDANQHLTYINPAVTRHTGYTIEEAITLPAEERYPPQTLKLMKNIDTPYNRTHATEYSFDVEIYRKDRSTFWAFVRFRVIRDEDGTFKGIIGVSTDITSRKISENELHKLAITDPMTGAFNRRYFNDQLLCEIIKATKYGTPFCVVLFDIDHFKIINDTHGHPTGDLVLTHLSNICQESQRRGDIFGRLGGDEFGLLLPNASLTDSLHTAERLKARLLASEVTSGATKIPFTISMGVTEYTLEDTPETIIERADQALYDAKYSGRNRIKHK